MKTLRGVGLLGLIGLVAVSCQSNRFWEDWETESLDPPEAFEIVEPAWEPLFDGASLDGWTARGGAEWTVEDGVIVGRSQEGHGHLYAAPKLTNLEVKGMFRITSEGESANSGLYFRANPPEDNVDGYPRGYEAQICNSQDAFTGWLWKPGTPTGEACCLLTEDGEWFSMSVRMIGNRVQIWVKHALVTEYVDDFDEGEPEYESGYFAIQCHNPGMKIEAKDLYYRDLSPDDDDDDDDEDDDEESA